MLGSTLSVAYTTKGQASDPLPANAAPVTPQVKQLLADEVDRQVKQEAEEAADNAKNREPQPEAASVVHELADRRPHVFVVSSDLDLVDPTGRRCSMSEGDVVQVTSGPKSDSGTVDAVVLATKGGEECGRAAQVQLALTDVQEMQNHMRETIDQGIANTKAGKEGQSVTPAFAASAPPADANAAGEIQQQQAIAAAAEG
jgi:methionine aminopeptidase